MPMADWEKLFALSDQHGFVIASDECYSEIYFRDDAPLGGLEAAAKLGRHDFKNLVAFTSLSKRSNVDNRALYREKFAAVTPMLAQVMDVRLPDAGFYLWAAVPGGDDTAFARELLAQYNVTVLPGSYLAREAHGFNPGAGRVRMALVAETHECVEAAQRIVAFLQR